MLKLLILTAVLGTMMLSAGDTVRPGLEPLEGQRNYSRGFAISQEELQLIEALKIPLLEGCDVERSLQCWFDGRLLDSRGKGAEARSLWNRGYELLKDEQKPLPQPPSKTPYAGTGFVVMERLSLSDYPSVRVSVVQWECSGLKQYGVLMHPSGRTALNPCRLVLYAHGAAFGIPQSFLNWLAKNLVMNGYAVIAPAMRGEPLWQHDERHRISEGEIENLEGEVDDCLTMLEAAWKLPFIRSREFAVIGHSFGAGAGLLAAMRSGECCRAVISYDAWLVNPQRYYWDRMRRNANNWLSWADYCNQPVSAQLAGLMRRSAVHQAGSLRAPALFFLGAEYAGSVFHQSHDDLFRRLRQAGRKYEYCAVAGGGHNFVLYAESRAAQEALKRQKAFLDKYYPPLSEVCQNTIKK